MESRTVYRPLFRKFFRAQGWTLNGSELAHHRRCVVIAAPHTTNWDLVYTLVSFDLMGLPVRFTVKKEFTRFPHGLYINQLGGIGIDRTPKDGSTERLSMVQAMINLFDEHPGDLAIVVTPEGTRSLRTEWKSGFYHVAKGAGVPILLGYLDYEKREAGIGKVIHPSDDYDADMREIAAFYQTIAPKFPELFSVDHRYVGDPPSEKEEFQTPSKKRSAL
ncbi:MAG: 1-acyl-sn-glycerol-3-phosphate acyltransferase [Bradymonadaceae bacterium]|nr:1-acyl-sn-glycerol-3-phosphate acyltransferase [Lujinxingiaceae bacterium]